MHILCELAMPMSVPKTAQVLSFNVIYRKWSIFQ